MVVTVTNAVLPAFCTKILRDLVPAGKMEGIYRIYAHILHISV